MRRLSRHSREAKPMINPVTTAEVIVAFLQSAAPGQALSMARAVHHIRSMDPRCELTDRQLMDIVASNAVAMGFPAILFDVDGLPAYRAARSEPASRDQRACAVHQATKPSVRSGRSAVRRTHRAMMLIAAGTAFALVGCQTYGMRQPQTHGFRHSMPPANCAMTGSTCESPR